MTDIADAITQQTKLTVKQVLEYTPQPDQVIESCFYRTSDWTSVLISKQSSCYQHFTVTRYVAQEFICYSFRRNNVSRNLSTDAVTLSRFKQFAVYDIALSPEFQSADHVLPIAHTDSFPYISRSFSDVAILRSRSSSNATFSSADYNLINIFPNDYTIQRLESPYDTTCVTRDQDEYFECNRECLLQEMANNYERIPSTEILPEFGIDADYDLKQVSTTELEDPGFEEQIVQTYKECHEKCHLIPCTESYTKTTFRTLVFKNNSLVLSSMAPTEADVVTQAQARMTFVEFFSFVCGCFGTWFGVSFVSGYRFYRKRRKAQKKKKKKAARVLPIDYHSDMIGSWRQIRGQKWSFYANKMSQRGY